jgi:hypothetical protein
MLAALEAEGLLPRPPVTLKIVDRESVRNVVLAERALLKRAGQLGIDLDEAHKGYTAHIVGIVDQLGEADRAEFERIFVEESLHDEEYDKALGGVAAAEAEYAKVLQESKPPSTARIFMAGVNTTILIGCLLVWIFVLR